MSMATRIASLYHGIQSSPCATSIVKCNPDTVTRNEALRQPELQDRLRKLSAEIFGGSAEKAAKYMREEVERWSEVIKAADVKLQ